jgi:hypothetical protein
VLRRISAQQRAQSHLARRDARTRRGAYVTVNRPSELLSIRCASATRFCFKLQGVAAVRLGVLCEMHQRGSLPAILLDRGQQRRRRAVTDTARSTTQCGETWALRARACPMHVACACARDGVLLSVA